MERLLCTSVVLWNLRVSVLLHIYISNADQVSIFVVDPHVTADLSIKNQIVARPSTLSTPPYRGALLLLRRLSRDL